MIKKDKWDDDFCFARACSNIGNHCFLFAYVLLFYFFLRFIQRKIKWKVRTYTLGDNLVFIFHHFDYVLFKCSPPLFMHGFILCVYRMHVAWCSHINFFFFEFQWENYEWILFSSYWIYFPFAETLNPTVVWDLNANMFIYPKVKQLKNKNSISKIILLDFVEVKNGYVSICKEAILGNCSINECKFIIFVLKNFNGKSFLLIITKLGTRTLIPPPLIQKIIHINWLFFFSSLLSVSIFLQTRTYVRHCPLFFLNNT